MDMPKARDIQSNEVRAGRSRYYFSALRKDIYEKKETRNFQSYPRKYC